jgi:snurportin-1
VIKDTTTGSINEYRIKPLPYYECDATGVQSAYSDKMPFIRDGLLFYCKAGHYYLGTTPLILAWKDEHTSR